MMEKNKDDTLLLFKGENKNVLSIYKAFLYIGENNFRSSVCTQIFSKLTRCRYWHLRVMLDCVIYCVTRLLALLENDVITTPQGREIKILPTVTTEK